MTYLKSNNNPGRFDSYVNYEVPTYVKIVTSTQVPKQHYKLIMLKIISGIL